MSAVDHDRDLDPAAALRAFTDVLEAIDAVSQGTARLVVDRMEVVVIRTGDGVASGKGQS